MTTKMDDRYGVPPLRQARFERVLIAGHAGAMTPAQVEKRCLARLTGLIQETAAWAPGGFRESWRLGDFNILIVETTVAPGAELYVQFWSEPNDVVAWEVSSGHLNPPLRKFVTARARAALGEMGFAVGGAAKNFGKTVSIANRGDAAAAARDTLRILHGAFGYRGLTPLVARVIQSGRSRRAVVYTRFSEGTTVTLLQELGFQTNVFRSGKRPVIGGRYAEVQFVVLPGCPIERTREFHCLDFVASVGHITDGSHAAWGEALNRLNGLSRVARGWIDEDGNVCVGMSLNGEPGVTEDQVRFDVSTWFRAAAELRGGPPRPRKRRKKAGRPADEGAGEDVGAGDEEKPKAWPVVH